MQTHMLLLQDVRRQLYVDEDNRKFYNWVQSQLKSTEKRLEDGRAVLHHLEAQLINVACDDPGAAIGAQLALPLLQERLDAKAQEYARQQAAQAEQDIIKMEVSIDMYLWTAFAALPNNRLHLQHCLAALDGSLAQFDSPQLSSVSEPSCNGLDSGLLTTCYGFPQNSHVLCTSQVVRDFTGLLTCSQ